MLLFYLALRNVFRNKIRSLLTIFMMGGGFVLLSFSLALVDGSYGNVIKFFTSSYTGHVQVHHKNYIKTPGLHDYFPLTDNLKSFLDKNPLVNSYSPRILSGALAFHKHKSAGAKIVGVDWEKELSSTNPGARIEKGSWPNQNDQNHVALGGKLAKILKINLNQEIILISQGADGSISNDIFIVKGIFKDEAGSRDNHKIYMDLASTRNFLSIGEEFHELAIFLKKANLAKKFSSKIHLPSELKARPWQVIESEFYRAMELDKKGNNISLAIIMVMVGIGVFNTVLMSILERTREFGLLKAIGTSSLQLTKQIFLEGQVLSFVSISLGLIIAAILNYYFSTNGISYGQEISYGGVTFSEMNTALTLTSFLYPALIVSFTTFLVGIYPSIKISSISPVDALRDY